MVKEHKIEDDDDQLAQTFAPSQEADIPIVTTQADITQGDGKNSSIQGQAGLDANASFKLESDHDRSPQRQVATFNSSMNDQQPSFRL